MWREYEDELEALGEYEGEQYSPAPPGADKSTAAGRARNRRVEIFRAGR